MARILTNGYLNAWHKPTVKNKSLFLRVFLRTVLLLGLLLGVAIVSQAQILDDTTRQIYNATTTRFFQVDDFRYNRDTTYYLDTAVDDIYRISWVDKSKKKYQNLGVVGTALHPIYPNFTDQIGARSGYEAFTPLYRGGSQLKHYDSRSPYTNIYAVFGENGRNLLDVTFTRNITPRLNVGIDVRTFLIDRNVGRPIGRSDRVVESYQYDAFASFSTKDNRYWVMGSFSRWNHEMFNTGGAQVDGDSLEAYGDVDLAITVLDDAVTSDLRQHYHVYQEYRFSKLFQVFHTFERYRQNNYYVDKLSSADIETYGGNTFIYSDSTKDRSIFRYTLNELGLKGTLGKVIYSISYKRRDGLAPYKFLDLENRFQENYLIGYGRLEFSPRHELWARGELLLSGPYKLDLHYHNRWISADWQRRIYQPAMLEQRYFGNHDEWTNNFGNISLDRFKVAAHLKTGPITWQPKADVSLVNNFVYWDENQLPAQATEPGQILTGGGEINFFLGGIGFDAEVLYTQLQGSAQTTFNMPEWFVRSELYYKGSLFQEALTMKGGVGFHTWSPYYRYGYDPVVQQFHLQNTAETGSWYPIVDLFLALQLGPATVIARYNHLTDFLYDNVGYLATPGYPGLPMTFDLGVKWHMYN